MKFILLLIIAGVAIYFLYVYFSNEQTKLKHKLILVTQYNEKLKKELCVNKKKNICAKFSTPANSSGILNEDTKIYIAPLNNSSIVNSTTSKIEVELIDECAIDEITWFYINMPSNSSMNCRGWVKKNDFIMLCSNSSEISTIPDSEEE